MVGRKEKITLLAVLLALFAAAPSTAQVLEEGKAKIAAVRQSYNKKFNIGVKAGFRSSNFIGSNLLIDGQKIDNLQNNYKMGYQAALYSRLNFHRHYLQTELSANVNRAEIVFDRTSTSSTSSSVSTSSCIRSTVYSLSFPLLYGFYAVRKGPYTMSVFAGPELKYLLNSNIDYSGFGMKNITESFYPFNLSGMVGVSVSISRIFFDFRYEQEVLNSSKAISYDSSSSTDKEEGAITFHRRESCLSFSLGVMF
jgi:hypothetical protein